jgi:glycopeptide antibiotics resistance protein
MWVTYALSDIPFATCVFGAILFWIECLVDPSRRLTKLLLCLCFGVLALTLRPSGPPLVAAFICALLWKLLFRQANAKRFDAMIVGGFVLGLASAVVITAAAGHYIFLISLQSDIRPELNFVRNYFIEGLVIHDRPETFLAPPTTSWQFMVLTLFRLASFFQIIVANFSWSHNILNALLFVPMYFCALFAMVYTRAIWRSRGEFCALSVASFFMTVLVFAVYQSLILIDYDWRYRLPVILPLVALSAVVFDVVVVAIGSLWRENARDVS